MWVHVVKCFCFPVSMVTSPRGAPVRVHVHSYASSLHLPASEAAFACLKCVGAVSPLPSPIHSSWASNRENGPRTRAFSTSRSTASLAVVPKSLTPLWGQMVSREAVNECVRQTVNTGVITSNLYSVNSIHNICFSCKNVHRRAGNGYASNNHHLHPCCFFFF